MSRIRTGIAFATAVVASGCGPMRLPRTPIDQPSTRTPYSSALECIGDESARSGKPLGLTLTVCPFAGENAEHVTQAVLDAFLRAARPGSGITVLDGRIDVQPPGMVEPRNCGLTPISVIGRFDIQNTESDGWGYFLDVVTSSLRLGGGMTTNHEVDRYSLSLVVREGRKISRLSATTSGDIVSEHSDTKELSAGASSAAGTIERDHTSTNDQGVIVRYAAEQAVFGLLQRYTEVGDHCYDRTQDWKEHVDEFTRLSERDKRRLRGLVVARRSGIRVPWRADPSSDRLITEDEYLLARASGILARDDVTGIVPGARGELPADHPLLHGLRVSRGRLESDQDGFVECLAFDRRGGGRVQRLAVVGSLPDGKIYRARSYRLTPPAPGMTEVRCYRSPERVFALLPAELRDYAVVRMPVHDVESLFGGVIASAGGGRS